MSDETTTEAPAEVEPEVEQDAPPAEVGCEHTLNPGAVCRACERARALAAREAEADVEPEPSA